MSTFEQALHAAGLRPREVAPDGKWRRWYEALIAKRIQVPPEGYSEKHHIVPRALGGGNQKSNIVRLTAREHFVAHALLARIFGGTMWLAVIRMKGRRYGDGYVNSRLHATAREQWSRWSSANQRGENHWAHGTTGWSSGKKLPQRSGNKHPMFGKKRPAHVTAAILAATTGSIRSDETKKKIADAQRGDKNHQWGKRLSDEHRAKVSSAMKKRKLSDEHKRRIGEAHKGKVVSEATKQKLREAALRRLGDKA